MLGLLILTTLLLSSNALPQGLTSDEINEFKPIDPAKVEQNTGVVGLVKISDPGSSKSYYTVYTNGVPSHSNIKWPRPEEGRPIYLNVTHQGINIPKTPKLRDSPLMCVPFGLVGVATGGVMIYNAYTPRKNCPIANLVEAFDMCMGHPDPGGGYHYHGHSSCNRMEVCGEESKIFGVALDGIPIYGPFDEQGKQLVQTDLDICGGRIGSDGRYKYHITGDPPFLLNCLRGEIHKDFFKTTNPTKGDFTCTCPLTDQGFPRCFEDQWCEDEDDDGYTVEERLAAEKKWQEWSRKQPKKPATCDFEETEGDFVKCKDTFNETYVKDYRQTYKYSIAKLIGCCPAGEDCGETCNDNSKCYFEQRQGLFLETETGISVVNGAMKGYAVLWVVALFIIF